MKIEPVMKIDYTATYKKYEDIAEVTYGEFIRRLKKKKMSVEDALTLRVVGGKEREKWLKVALDNGISVNLFNDRYSWWGDYERAATQPRRKISEKGIANMRKGAEMTLKARAELAKYKEKELFDIEREIKMLINAGMPLKKKYQDYIIQNSEKFEGLI